MTSWLPLAPPPTAKIKTYQDSRAPCACLMNDCGRWTSKTAPECGSRLLPRWIGPWVFNQCFNAIEPGLLLPGSDDETEEGTPATVDPSQQADTDDSNGASWQAQILMAGSYWNYIVGPGGRHWFWWCSSYWIYLIQYGGRHRFWWSRISST